jgi:2-polyprenyl-6-methoxyphenol hydroxylase-like FAD-dependent oxidoreductase
VKIRKVISEQVRHATQGLSVAADVNAVVVANVEEKEARMADEYRNVTREELMELAGEELPERAAMSLVNANIAIPINAAVAANVLSDGAVAYADAAQNTPIEQGN